MSEENRKPIEWAAGSAFYKKLDVNTYILEYSIRNNGYREEFSGTVNLRNPREACMFGKWVAVPRNPFVSWYDSSVIYGGSPLILVKKVLKQIEKWREEDKDGKQYQYQSKEQSTGKEDSELPWW